MKKLSKKSKSVPPRKRLKKYEEGGKEVQGLKRNSTWDPFPGSNVPTAPKTEAIEMKLESEPVSKENLIQKNEQKPKLLPGGFTSEAQKQAYIRNAKKRISNGETVKSLVDSKFGTAAGLKALGIVDKPVQVKKSTPNKTKPITPVKQKVEVKKQPVKQKPEVKSQPVKQKPEVKSQPVKQKVEVKKQPVKPKKIVETEGQRLARVGKQQANSYKGSPERSSRELKTGRLDTIVNTKQSGNKQTKVIKYDKKGNKVKTFYKEAAPRMTIDSTGRKYLNSKGTVYTEIDRVGNKKVTIGKNIKMDPVKKDTFSKGSVIKKIVYRNPSGFGTTLDLSKKPAKLKKGGKLKINKKK